MSLFAKRQSALAAAAGTPPARRSLRERAAPVLALMKKPPAAVAGAGLLLLGAAALFLTVLGDPRAGTPSARVSLTREAVAPPPAPTGLDAFSAGAMDLYQDLTLAEATLEPAGAAGGEALITLPDGATVSGGSNITAPRREARPLPPPTAGYRPRPMRVRSGPTANPAWP